MSQPKFIKATQSSKLENRGLQILLSVHFANVFHVSRKNTLTGKNMKK